MATQFTKRIRAGAGRKTPVAAGRASRNRNPLRPRTAVARAVAVNPSTVPTRSNDPKARAVPGASSGRAWNRRPSRASGVISNMSARSHGGVSVAAGVEEEVGVVPGAGAGVARTAAGAAGADDRHGGLHQMMNSLQKIGRRGQRQRWCSAPFQRWLREPLLHFVVVGFALFAIYGGL